MVNLIGDDKIIIVWSNSYDGVYSMIEEFVNVSEAEERLNNICQVDGSIINLVVKGVKLNIKSVKVIEKVELEEF